MALDDLYRIPVIRKLVNAFGSIFILKSNGVVSEPGEDGFSFEPESVISSSHTSIHDSPRS